jgi:phenylalanyl-tRNA synthetase beta chain
MPEEVAVSAVASAIGEAGGDLLEDVALFDVYAGEELPDGRRSLAFRLRFRAVDRTLAEEDVKPAWDAIVASIGSLKGELRG